MDYTIFLWEPYICAHILPWAHGLVKDKRVKAVYYIAPCAVIAYRKEMGWSENDIPKNDGVNYIIAPDDKKFKEIYETDTDTPADTSDPTDLMLWGGIAMLAAGAAVTAMAFRRREN